MISYVGFCKFILLLSIITIDFAIAKNDPNCGIKGPKPIPDLLSILNNLRIIGGEDALPGEFPWLCSLRSDNKHQCGGSIIKPQFIVTAGHCVAPLLNDENFEIVCGTNTISPSTTEVRAKVVKKLPHPHFDWPQNDIALLKLDHALNLSLPRLGSVCLPEPNEPLSLLESKNSISAGWGLTDADIKPDKLQKVVLKIWKQKECAKVWSESDFNKSITKSHICIGGNGKGNCYGDSGSCLVHFNTTTKRWTDIGVTSFGPPGCHGPEPFVDTRVSTFVKWIWDTVAANTEQF